MWIRLWLGGAVASSNFFFETPFSLAEDLLRARLAAERGFAIGLLLVGGMHAGPVHTAEKSALESGNAFEREACPEFRFLVSHFECAHHSDAGSRLPSSLVLLLRRALPLDERCTVVDAALMQPRTLLGAPIRARAKECLHHRRRREKIATFACVPTVMC